MGELEITIGGRIRSRRLGLDLTLQALAERVGISKAMLSKIELGKVSTPISTYSRIAKELGMSLASLFGERRSELLLIRKDDEKPRSARTTSGYLYEMLGEGWPNKLWSAYIITYDPSPTRTSPGFHHDFDEFYYVLEGRMKFNYRDEAHILFPGDCIFFDGSEPHGGQAYGGEPCKALLILTPKD